MAVLLLLITLRLLTPLALAPPLLAPRTTVPAMIDSAESSLNEQRRSWTCSEPPQSSCRLADSYLCFFLLAGRSNGSNGSNGRSCLSSAALSWVQGTGCSPELADLADRPPDRPAPLSWVQGAGQRRSSRPDFLSRARTCRVCHTCAYMCEYV